MVAILQAAVLKAADERIRVWPQTPWLALGRRPDIDAANRPLALFQTKASRQDSRVHGLAAGQASAQTQAVCHQQKILDGSANTDHALQRVNIGLARAQHGNCQCNKRGAVRLFARLLNLFYRRFGVAFTQGLTEHLCQPFTLVAWHHDKPPGHDFTVVWGSSSSPEHQFDLFDAWARLDQSFGQNALARCDQGQRKVGFIKRH